MHTLFRKRVDTLEIFMEAALEQAKIAFKLKEVPVGAVIIKDNKIIARAHNLTETLQDPTAHAEIIVIRKAAEVLGNWRLNDCSLYVTLEPCPMCAAAIAHSRISSLFIGTFDQEKGACGSVVNVIQNEYLKYRVNVKWTYNDKCSDILTKFFKDRRNKDK